ncbi:hypothetical protein GCM10023331_16030 [Algivirga pacifica]|uniref:Tetratricopeptide repeat-containing protein n=2 Tax=Algivirga pacifica TaxID=1162670 RepID=A0ABP9D9J4_9BACT
MVTHTSLGQSQKLDPYIALGVHMDSSIYEHDYHSLSPLLDYNVFSRKALHYFKVSEEEALAFEEELREQISMEDILGVLVEDDGRYEFVKVLDKANGEKSLLFRQVYSDGWLNYQEYLLHTIGDKLLIKDIYSYESGSYLSDRIGTSYLTEDIYPVRSGYVQQYHALADSIFYYNQMTAFKESWRVYQTLPRYYKDKESYLLSAIIALSAIEVDKEIPLLQRYQDKYPQSPGVHLVMTDVYKARGLMDAAIKELEILEEYIGGDAFLMYKKAECYATKGDLKKAEKLCKVIIEEKNEMTEAELLLLDCYYLRGKHKFFLENLLVLAEKLSVEPEVLCPPEDYPVFFSSDIWQEWLKRTKNG